MTLVCSAPNADPQAIILGSLPNMFPYGMLQIPSTPVNLTITIGYSPSTTSYPVGSNLTSACLYLVPGINKVVAIFNTYFCMVDSQGSVAWTPNPTMCNSGNKLFVS